MRQPEPGIGPGDSSKIPARRGLDPRPDPCHRLDLQPLRRCKLPGPPLCEVPGELRRPAVGAAEITNAPENSAPNKESNDAKTPKKGPIAWSVESNRKKRMCLKN